MVSIEKLEYSIERSQILGFLNTFVKEELDNFLHRHPETADQLLQKILNSEKGRKELRGIQKIARERAKKARLHNRKLRDCKVHLGGGPCRRR